MKSKALLRWGLVVALFAAVFQGCQLPYPGDSPDIPALLTSAPTQPSLTPPASPAPGQTQVSPSQSTPQASPTAVSSADLPLYAVVLVSADNVLNVRTAPGLDQPILEMLAGNAREISLTGAEQELDGERWVEIKRGEAGTGWVYGSFLTQQVSPQAFCSDPKVKAFVTSFLTALSEQDFAGLAVLTSPTHGLTIQTAWYNEGVTFKREQVAGLLQDDTVFAWGIEGGSGLPIQGTFKATVLPQMLNLFQGEVKSPCNSLEVNVGSGPTPGQTPWLFEYGNLNFVALYRAAPADQELDWRTWAVGIEIIAGSPYAMTMVQYRWEP